jgi:alkanesulfonate monooxygenase SsuD/methylene tetrahydromethanopterin reductase-like flavin-dependent oxidoreductase (luciferase family)
MNFGLFYYCQGRGVPHDQAYAEMLDQIVLAERLGFDECWFAEHHFTDYSLLSFHHPLRLAAEAAMLDNLARGRFDFGVGKGVRPGEFAQLGLRFEDGVAMTEEAIEVLLKAWTNERTSHTGRFWTFPEFSLRPRVFQRPHPPLHEVASRPASVARVGARGCRSRCTSRRRRSSPAACRTIATRWRRDASRSAPARTGRGCCCAARPTWPSAPRSRGRRARWRCKGSGICRRWRHRRHRLSSPTSFSRI